MNRWVKSLAMYSDKWDQPWDMHIAAFEMFQTQTDVTCILTVGWSVIAVKLKVNSQGPQKLSSHRSNKKFNHQGSKENLKPTMKYYKFI